MCVVLKIEIICNIGLKMKQIEMVSHTPHPHDFGGPNFQERDILWGDLASSKKCGGTWQLLVDLVVTDVYWGDLIHISLCVSLEGYCVCLCVGFRLRCVSMLISIYLY